MLHEANYDLHSQYEGLIFYYRLIAGRLGSRPTPNGMPKGWKSYMTDDFSPLELSWSWEDVKQLKVRYSVEAIGRDAGTASDPFNQARTLELVRQLHLALSDTDWQLFDYFSKSFSADGDTKLQEHCSSMFF